ncbi:MAG: hypothetical protein ACOX6L_02775 [Syntrophomonadaceae bacterium]
MVPAIVKITRYPGYPDIVFPKYRAIVFLSSCFWHSYERDVFWTIECGESFSV